MMPAATISDAHMTVHAMRNGSNAAPFPQLLLPGIWIVALIKDAGRENLLFFHATLREPDAGISALFGFC